MRNILSFHKKIGWKPGANTLLYWPLTENANDYSGNGNNGTAYSSVSFSSNGAYFSGSSYNTNFIDFPSSFYPGTSFTVSLRIKKGENNKELRMFSDWGPSYRRILWALTSSGYTNLLFGNGSTSQSEWSNIQAYSANTWYNYVLVKDGTNATIYRDGVLVGTHTFSYNSSPGGLSGGEYGIGNIRTSTSSASMGTGYVKDYIIENKLRTAQEVLDYYNKTKSAYIEEGWTPGSNTIAYYPLTKNANDKSGNNRNGTVNSGVSFTTQSGIECSYFNGTSSGYIAIPGLGTLNSVTTSLWIKSTMGANSTIFSLCPSSDNANYQIYGPSDIGASRWNGSDSDYKATGVACNNGNWHNVIVTNGSDGFKVYVDGTLRASSTIVRTIKSDTNYSQIGVWRYQSSGYYLGYISEVIIEDKVRTAQEIQDYYNQTKSNYGL